MGGQQGGGPQVRACESSQAAGLARLRWALACAPAAAFVASHTVACRAWCHVPPAAASLCYTPRLQPPLTSFQPCLLTRALQLPCLPLSSPPSCPQLRRKAAAGGQARLQEGQAHHARRAVRRPQGLPGRQLSVCSATRGPCLHPGPARHSPRAEAGRGAARLVEDGGAGHPPTAAGARRLAGWLVFVCFCVIMRLYCICSAAY